MSVDFGTDIDCTTSIGSRFKLASGFVNLANAMVRRLITPRGTLDYAPDYGYDVRDWLNHDMGQVAISTIEAAIDAECQKDDRVQTSSSTVVPNVLLQTMTITVAIITAAGPFKFVTTVDKLNAILTSVTS